MRSEVIVSFFEKSEKGPLLSNRNDTTIKHAMNNKLCQKLTAYTWVDTNEHGNNDYV